MTESDKAAVVQGDRSILVEVDHPAYEEARSALAPFAEIEKSPEHVHTYRISALSLWNAASTGLGAEEVIGALRRISRFDVPSHLEHEIRETMSRHGVCSLHDVSGDPTVLRLAVKNELVKKQLAHSPKASEYLRPCPDGFLLEASHRGVIKQVLLKVGFPVDDRAGMREGEALPIATRADVFEPYPYQRAAARAFIDAGSHGVVVLPCGAGKTVVAMLAMADLSTRTLVLATGADAAEQWKRELAQKTDLPPDAVAIYGAKKKDVGPVTITSYSMLAQKGGNGPTKARHFDRLASEGFGLIVYDEVHLLPAPVFRLTAEIQARRRLGLTATLVREDGRASDVFALIGPKRFDIPWRELEKSGHIAKALCIEVRVPFPESLRDGYAIATPGPEQSRAASDNPEKLRALGEIVERHGGDRVLVLGTYLELLKSAAEVAGAALVTGETPSADRVRAYEAFRRGEIRRLALSRVGNFAIDLPEANVLVQISGTMGSRQEEAQRLGRILRPKPGGATFYTLVSKDTVEAEHALHRQLFLTEQGYRYFIEDWSAGRDAETLH